MKFDHRGNPDYYGRRRDVLSSSRYTLGALFAAIGFVAVGVGGRIWAFIPALLAAVFAIVDTALAWRGLQAADTMELQTLLAREACRVEQAHAGEYGVDKAVLPDNHTWHYVQRDFDVELRTAIQAALAKTGSPLVMLSGDTKSARHAPLSRLSHLKSYATRGSWFPRTAPALRRCCDRAHCPAAGRR